MLKEHNKDEYLVAALDRSVKHMHQMSFGWGLSTVGRLHFVKLFDGCDDRGSSLRVEAVGMLFISIFIPQMAKHRNRTNIRIKYVFDNLELVNRSKQHLNYINPYSNTTLSAEYDITKKVYLMKKIQEIKP